jgi:hypothetical protein
MEVCPIKPKNATKVNPIICIMFLLMIPLTFNCKSHN